MTADRNLYNTVSPGNLSGGQEFSADAFIMYSFDFQRQVQ